MSKFRNDVLNALLEEMEMDKADGKGVADKTVTTTAKPSTATGETKVKLSGDGKEVGGKLPDHPPSDGKVPGGEDGVKSPEGKGVAKKNVGDVKTSEGGKGEVMKAAGEKMAGSGSGGGDGKGVAAKEVKQTPDLPKNPNVAESFVLPHEVMVEHDGKQVKLSAGTRFRIVKEAKKCEDDDCKDEKCPTHGKKDCNESVVKEEDEKPFGGDEKEEKDEKPAEEKEEPAEEKEEKSEEPAAEEPAVEEPVAEEEPMMDEMTNISNAGSDMSIIDRLAMSIDDLAGATGNFAKDLKEFLGVEATEPAHQEGAESMEPEMGMEAEMPAAVDGAAEDAATMDFNAPAEGFNDADLPADKPEDNKLPF